MENGLKEILVIDLAISLLIVLFYFFPPKELNSIYGYRTKRSTKDQKSWNFAQKHSSQIMIYIPFFVIFSQILMILSGADVQEDFSFIINISISIYIIGFIACFISTESALKKKQENPDEN
ncbi:SdpI family protein [Ornithobacterium rhinotracheale]|uniref:SdpI family protein n=1 Tax=Ornithobacterium rhinotracheale TaxID=28251 RepID=A0A3R6ASW3_ORNRH|nr:SdpI family protein [Ornithobacterium rhinotracheale]QAR29866.1 SdpI family protein [Ornithobacterium rhinotracheale]